MEYLLSKEPRIHYAQRRPMQTLRYSEGQVTRLLDHGGSITMDCSEAVTCLCKWAGLHDPTGFHFSGYGNTSSMFAHLPHYTDPSRALVGALVVYGAGGYHHVCMVNEPGHDPLLWSHGREAGPVLVRHSVELASQPRPFTYLNVSHL
jgi:hypothetical protein